MSVELQKFCENATNCRIKRPFNKGPWTYATNGHIMIRVPLIAGFRDDGPNAEKLYDDAMKADGECVAFAIPALPPVTIDSEECSKCNGSGSKHDCPGCTCECEECEGAGEVKTNSDKAISVQIGKVPFACEYIRLLGELPGLCLREPAEEKALLFKFDGGEGMLMPLRTTRLKTIKAKWRRPENGEAASHQTPLDSQDIWAAQGGRE